MRRCVRGLEETESAKYRRTDMFNAPFGIRCERLQSGQSYARSPREVLSIVTRMILAGSCAVQCHNPKLGSPALVAVVRSRMALCAAKRASY